MKIEELQVKLNALSIDKDVKLDFICADDPGAETHKIIVDGEDVSWKTWAVIFIEEKK